MTPRQVELMRSAARNLLAHHDAGRKCDPHALEWARWVTRADWPTHGAEPPKSKPTETACSLKREP